MSRYCENGRGDRNRTYDIRFWRPTLYQLSYTPLTQSRQDASYYVPSGFFSSRKFRLSVFLKCSVKFCTKKNQHRNAIEIDDCDHNAA